MQLAFKPTGTALRAVKLNETRLRSLPIGFRKERSISNCTGTARISVVAQALPFFGQKSQPPTGKDVPDQPEDSPVGDHHEHAPARFSLPLAVALAGCAFESYYEPVGAAGFQEKGLNSANITYTDGVFLSEVCQGVLHVELVRASGLRKADITGASDPYAVLTVGQSSARSKVISATLDPVWNETFFLYVKDFEDDVLKIRLYDEDFLKSDDDLGLTQVALSQVPNDQQKSFTLTLRGPGGQGEVEVRLKALRFSDHMLDLLTSDGLAVPEANVPAQPKQEEVNTKLLAAAATPEEREPPKPSGQLPDLGILKDQLSAALNRLGLLDTNGGVTSEEVAANPWKVLARMTGSSHGNTWVPVAFVENHESDTQAWLYRSEDTHEAVVAFRGTEQIKWKDLATDVNLVPCSLNPERVDDGEGLPLPMKLLRAIKPNNDMMVHSGFLSAYDSIRPQVFRLLDDITRQRNPLDSQPWKVYVTGHSLGGALATLCSYELSIRQGPQRARQHITMYTYGAPRVGNRTFAEAFNKLVPDSWRITNSNDIIPTVPRLLGYAHVKHGVKLSDGGQILIQGDTGSDVFGEGRGGLDVIQELADQVSKQERTFEEVYEEIAAAELAILDTLVNGKALEEHMEDFYLATLKEVVIASTAPAIAEAAEAAAKLKEEKQ